MTSPPVPRVSILLPCRDAGPHLQECIDSLIAQTETRFEALVLDDGSTDRTREILAAWVERDPRARPVEPRGRGIVDALNDLAAAARAPILARMDADDIARPERLAAQLALLDDRPETAACGTGVRYFPRERARSGYRRYEKWLNGLATPEEIERDLFVECPIAHPTLVIRRRTLEDIGGYRDIDGPEDYDLVLRLAAAGHSLANVPEVLLDWRLGEGRLSEGSERYSPEAFRRLKIAHLLEGPLHPERLGDRELWLWGGGKVGKAFLRSWAAAGQPPFDAIVDLDPRKVGQTIHGAQVVGPDVLDKRFRGNVDRPFVLGAVGSPGARDDIRCGLEAMGARELVDYRMIA
ncbi:MAG: glycosyltransferase [Gemmatimonadota bacterium]|nr:glycosyltransferase [Gemmatimonadota bacterium]